MMPPIPHTTALVGMLWILSGCDAYLPACSSAAMLDEVSEKAIRQTGMARFIAVGMVEETSRNLSGRSRECRAILQARDDFAAAYAGVREGLSAKNNDGLIGMLGKAVASAAIPDRLESTWIHYSLIRDEKSGNFKVMIPDGDLDGVVRMSGSYQMADIAIHEMMPRHPPDAKDTPPKSGEI